MDVRVQLLLDKDEIRELVYRYAHLIIVRDWAGMANLFTEDATMDYSQAVAFMRLAQATETERAAGSTLVFVGRQAIRDYLPVTERLAVKAFFTNHIIRIRGEAAVGV